MSVSTHSNERPCAVLKRIGLRPRLALRKNSFHPDRLDKRFRLNILPISIGFPFGVNVIMPPNVPLPTKIVVQVLEPIDIAAQFGADPDVNEVDRYVRSVMQEALDAFVADRRFPIVG